MGPAYILLTRGLEKEVPEFDAVWDLRKLIEEGYYRDTQTLVTQAQTQTAGQHAGLGALTDAAPSAGPDYSSAQVVSVNEAFQNIPLIPLTTITPTVQGDSDEISHTPPRQLSWRRTMLTFLKAAGAAKTISAVSTGAETLTCAGHGLAGWRVSVNSTLTLPAPLLPGVAYFVTAPTVDTFQLAYVADGPPINLTTEGTGVITAVPQLIVSETPWANIQSWSLGRARRIT